LKVNLYFVTLYYACNTYIIVIDLLSFIFINGRLIFLCFALQVFGYGDGYQKYLYHVLEVNKTSYENCIDTEIIKNISRGGRQDVFQLTEDKIYYFISGGGGCWSGLKVAIDVNEYVAPAPEPTPHKGGSDALNIQIYHSLVVLILTLMCTNLLV